MQVVVGGPLARDLIAFDLVCLLLFVPVGTDYASFLDIPSTEWIDGKVVSMVDYGAFVRLPQGVDGMVHISQMGSQGQRVASVYEELQVRGRATKA